jgi:ABC-type uncharacterized transport system substrate-binding protein
MRFALNRLLLGLLLIAAAAAILLVSDLNHRVERSTLPRVAILQFSTRPILDACVTGLLDGLEKEGFVDGQGMKVERYNAENDLATANTISHSIVDRRYDLVMTVSTPCLQAFAGVNQKGTVNHVFCGVTDPFSAGVGISSKDPTKHPKHLAGIGTFQPVESTFRIAKQLYPDLKRVGEAWNPAEACSEACTVKARAICKELGIELIEANVDSSSAVLEAVNSLISRGAQAIWIGGDNTVEIAVDSIIQASRKAKIPVFSNSPGNLERGLLYALGADYEEVGNTAGILAGKILKGLDPASVRIEDVMPESLALNLGALKLLRDPWSAPPDLIASAAVVLDENGTALKKQTAAPEAESPTGRVAGSPASEALSEGKPASTAIPATASRPVTRKWNLHFVNYVEASHVEEAHDGFFKQFKELGMVDGRDYSMKVTNAQGDMASLMTLMDNAVTDRADLILTTSTPTLQAAIKRAENTPIIFTNVANPVLIGAGESFEKHLPNVTGICSLSDFEGMVRVVKECLPSARTIGTLFVPSEVNSVCYRDELVKAAEKAGMELISMSVSNSNEVAVAASSLAMRGIDAYCQISDSLCDTAFPGISRTAQNEKIPLFSFVTSLAVQQGAAIAVARDYRQGGRDLASLAVSFMQGASIRDIPIRYINKTIVTVNLKNAELCGLRIPDALLARADRVIR